MSTSVPTYTANRLQRWAWTLLLYDFSINFNSTDSSGQFRKKHGKGYISIMQGLLTVTTIWFWLTHTLSSQKWCALKTSPQPQYCACSAIFSQDTDNLKHWSLIMVHNLLVICSKHSVSTIVLCIWRLLPFIRSQTDYQKDSSTHSRESLKKLQQRGKR